MPLDKLPGEVIVSTRDELAERHKRSFRTRIPEADTGPGTQPHVTAGVVSDVALPILAAAKLAGKNAVLEESRGEAADQWGEREGVDERRPAIGATGFVVIQATTGGDTIQDGDFLVNEETNLRYKAVGTAHYNSGDPCPITGHDTGIDTNVDPGTLLKWEAPPTGIFQNALVLENSDGSGLTGGREAESSEEYVERILEEKRTRAASGNDAEYQLEAQRTPAVAVQKAFTYPGIMGPGVGSLVFTLRPAFPGGSRIPNAAQVALVSAHCSGKFPADDGATFGFLANVQTAVVYSVAWAEGAPGWADATPWPRYYAPFGTPGAVVVQSASSSTSFILATDNGDYTNIVQPQAGQVLAFFDPVASNRKRFKRKQILSVTGTGPWTIVCDTTNGVSETSYTPQAGQRAMPWSDSLEEMLAGLFTYFDGLGPGEQVATFYDDGGRRQKRIPRPPRDWPMTLTKRKLIDAVEIDAVEDLDVLEGDGVTPPTGVPGVVSNILLLTAVSVFPET